MILMLITMIIIILLKQNFRFSFEMEKHLEVLKFWNFEIQAHLAIFHFIFHFISFHLLFICSFHFIAFLDFNAFHLNSFHLIWLDFQSLLHCIEITNIFCSFKFSPLIFLSFCSSLAFDAFTFTLCLEELSWVLVEF